MSTLQRGVTSSYIRLALPLSALVAVSYLLVKILSGAGEMYVRSPFTIPMFLSSAIVIPTISLLSMLLVISLVMYFRSEGTNKRALKKDMVLAGVQIAIVAIAPVALYVVIFGNSALLSQFI